MYIIVVIMVLSLSTKRTAQYMPIRHRHVLLLASRSLFGFVRSYTSSHTVADLRTSAHVGKTSSQTYLEECLRVGRIRTRQFVNSGDVYSRCSRVAYLTLTSLLTVPPRCKTITLPIFSSFDWLNLDWKSDILSWQLGLYQLPFWDTF